MRPAKYDKRVTVQQRTKTETEIKGWTNVWTDLYTSWASVIPMSGAKAVDYSRMGFTESYELEMRKRATNVNSNCRIVYNSKNFQINSLIVHNVVKLDIARK